MISIGKAVAIIATSFKTLNDSINRLLDVAKLSQYGQVIVCVQNLYPVRLAISVSGLHGIILSSPHAGKHAYFG